MSNAGAVGSGVCAHLSGGAAGARTDATDINCLCHYCTCEGAEHDPRRRDHKERRKDNVCHVHRFYRNMVVWCTPGTAGRLCLETSDSVGVFHSVAGGSRTAIDLDCLIPQKSLDGAVIRR